MKNGKINRMRDARVGSLIKKSRFPVRHYLFVVLDSGVQHFTLHPSDPFTAIACVDRLGSSLCRLARRDMPSALRFDRHGLRLVAPGPSFAGIVDTAFNQIRQSARSNPAVAIRMLDAIAQIADQVQRAPDAPCLQRQAGMIVKGAREAVPEADDLLAVEAAFVAATQALRKLRA